jgi:hypothetical protein
MSYQLPEEHEKLTLKQMVADFAGNVGSRKECDFVLFVQDCYTQEERNEVLEGLMGCRCCIRHHKEAPIEKDCMCNCRHYARLFKRKNLA